MRQSHLARVLRRPQVVLQSPLEPGPARRSSLPVGACQRARLQARGPRAGALRPTGTYATRPKARTAGVSRQLDNPHGIRHKQSQNLNFIESTGTGSYFASQTASEAPRLTEGGTARQRFCQHACAVRIGLRSALGPESTTQASIDSEKASWGDLQCSSAL